MSLRVLDLFCGCGGAGEGYARAGFDVFGIDLSPQPRNAAMAAQADVLKLSPRFLRLFDLVHASPPCQAHTDLKSAPGAKHHDDLIPAQAVLGGRGGRERQRRGGTLERRPRGLRGHWPHPRPRPPLRDVESTGGADSSRGEDVIPALIFANALVVCPTMRGKP